VPRKIEKLTAEDAEGRREKKALCFSSAFLGALCGESSGGKYGLKRPNH